MLWQSESEHDVTRDRNGCKPEDLSALFKLGGNAFHYLHQFFFCVGDDPQPQPQAGGTSEASYISFSDANIGSVLKTVIPDGRMIRDNVNSHNTAGSKSLRPDYAFITSGMCIFRDEEEGYRGLRGIRDDPRAELVEKMKVYPYHPAPYVLGTLRVMLSPIFWMS